MRKMFALLSLLVVASMLLAACGPAATEAPAEVEPAPATQEPAATEAPVAEEPAGPTSQYIGSGMLDGNGVPPDFFSDVHIRKAFGYAFDWDTYIVDVSQGEAVQSFQLPLAGMPGFDSNAPHYTYDLEKSAEEFKLADLDHDGVPAGEDPEGDVWTTGFRIQMLYNQGNTTRQAIAEILSASLAEVNELFSVEILGLPWPAYLAGQRAGTIPIMTAGWQEDIHDPHNWYQPYTTGSYGGRQNMPEDMKAQFKELLDKGVGETDPAKRDATYKEMNQMYYDVVPGAILTSGISHAYEQLWVEGRVYNPIMSGDYYYPMTKVAPATDLAVFNNVTYGDVETLDPARVYDTFSGEVVQNTYETLVFYDGEATDKFVPQLAESWETSADGTVWTFKIRPDVKFHNGDVMTPSDVAWTFQRGILQGGTSSPQWLLTEPFLGAGVDDIAAVVDPEGSVYDDRAAMQAYDPAALVAACEQVKAAIVADDAAGTVTMTLAQPWGPFLATIAQTWGSVMDQKWAVEQGAWDGSCDTWQNYYVNEPDTNQFNAIENGTGPFILDTLTPGEEIVLVRNDNYWREPAQLERVNFKMVEEWGTRFAMAQAGDADIFEVNPEDTPQADELVGEVRFYNESTNSYDPAVPLCSIDDTQTGVAKFIACGAGETGTGGMFRLLIGRPSIVKSVIIYNFTIK
jgi:ABC-type transport system substrate-binding protein